MRRRLVVPAVLVLLIGAAAGALGALALQPQVGRAGHPPPVTPAAVPEPGPRVLLVWTHAGLPAGLPAAVGHLAGVQAVTPVAGGEVDMSGSTAGDGRPADHPPPGWSIPLDTAAVDPATYPAFVPPGARELVGSLAPGRVLLGTTSAGLRRLGTGAVLDLAGRQLNVAGVVDDVLVGAAEAVVSAEEGRALGLRERYLLVAYTGDRAGLEALIRGVLPAGLAVRFRGPGETPFLREGDAVLPQALVKARFGEFAYRRGLGSDIVVDPAFEAENVVAETVPLLGRVRCHRAVLPALRGAMDELGARGLATLVDANGFGGCYVPRTIAPGESLSRHAWGVAFDLNTGKNPTGLIGVQDPRLIAVMRRWGFTSGASWLVPDPSHFEYLRPPEG